jgi:hypothetical protein
MLLSRFGVTVTVSTGLISTMPVPKEPGGKMSESMIARFHPTANILLRLMSMA